MLRFSEDGQLYRAKILTLKPLTVVFIDYGNKEETKDVFVMPASLKNVPPYANLIKISCLAGVENSAENVAKLDQSFGASETKMKMVEQNAADFVLDGVQLSRTPFRPLKVANF